MSNVAMTAGDCTALVAQIDSELAAKRATYDEIALAAVADPATAPARDRLRDEIAVLIAQRADAVAAGRAAMRLAAQARETAAQRLREAAYAHAERSIREAEEQTHELGRVLIRASELFSQVRESEAAWQSAVAPHAGRLRFEPLTFVGRFTAEISRCESTLDDDSDDIARLTDRATQRAATLLEQIAAILSVTPHPTTV